MTGIEWTDETWNPTTGCTKVSAGCKNCYAEGISERFWAKQYPRNDDGSLRMFTDVRCHPDRLDQPLRWRKPRRVFVNSMSDLFHEDVPDLFITRVFEIMAASKEHTFQVLTKRPGRMLSFLGSNHRTEPYDRFGAAFPLSSVWLGVSCEDQATADERIPLLLKTPAAVRFVSCEPLLGAVDLFSRAFLDQAWAPDDPSGPPIWRGLDWVIVGGESGPKARPMDLDWARSIIAQCRAAGVPVFVKQLGGWPDKRNRPDEWPAALQVREFPQP